LTNRAGSRLGSLELGVKRDGPRKAAVIVAHPDDEVLWAGGTILLRPRWSWHVASLCRAGDADRAPKFHRVVAQLGAAGSMGELDDGPEQHALNDAQVRETVLSILPAAQYDLILTHGPRGEYTRHRRHEETCRAVVGLWADGALSAVNIWMFGFEDGGGAYLPRAQAEATTQESFSEEIWRRKYRLLTEGYGFAPESWEARATPRSEAFWSFHDALADCRWVDGEHRRECEVAE
jgi:hypothetical protein